MIHVRRLHRRRRGGIEYAIDELESENGDLRERVAALERCLDPADTASPAADD